MIKSIEQKYSQYLEQIKIKKNTTIAKLLALKWIDSLSIIRFNNVNYFKNNNEWHVFIQAEELVGYISELDQSLDRKELNSLIYWINVILKSNICNIEWDIDEKILFFKNGYVDLNKKIEKGIINGGVFMPLTKDKLYLLPIPIIPFNFKNKEIDPILNKLLNWFSNDNELQKNNILKMLAIVMTNTSTEYFFNLYGVGGSGKSTLLDLARQLVGFNYCVDKPIADLNKRFQLIPLIGKKLFFNGDASKEEIEPSILKNLTTTGHVWDIEVKGMNQSIQTTLPMNIIINSNHKLNFSSFGSEMTRRIIPIHFSKVAKNNEKALSKNELKKIKPQNKDKYFFKENIVESMMVDLLINLQEFINYDKEWIYSQNENESINDINKSNNNLLQWLETIDLEDEINRNWDNNLKYKFVKSMVIYESYKQYIMEAGGKPKGKNMFINDLKEYLEKRGYKVFTNLFINEKGRGYFGIEKN